MFFGMKSISVARAARVKKRPHTTVVESSQISYPHGNYAYLRRRAVPSPVVALARRERFEPYATSAASRPFGSWTSRTIPKRRSTKLWRKTPSPSRKRTKLLISSTAKSLKSSPLLGNFQPIRRRSYLGKKGAGGGRGSGFEPSPRSPGYSSELRST